MTEECSSGERDKSVTGWKKTMKIDVRVLCNKLEKVGILMIAVN